MAKLKTKIDFDVIKEKNKNFADDRLKISVANVLSFFNDEINLNFRTEPIRPSFSYFLKEA